MACDGVGWWEGEDEGNEGSATLQLLRRRGI